MSKDSLLGNPDNVLKLRENFIDDMNMCLALSTNGPM